MPRPRFSGLHAARVAVVALAFCLALLALPNPSAHTRPTRPAAAATAMTTKTAANVYRQANLVSSIPGIALVLDPLMTGARGIALTPTSPFCVAKNTPTLYRGDVAGGPLVRDPVVPLIQTSENLTTAVVANTTQSFRVIHECFNPPCPGGPAQFIFATSTGRIHGWHPSFGTFLRTSTVVSDPTRNYTGLAIGNNGSGDFLYAADFAGGNIDVYNTHFVRTTLAGNFTDPNLPAGFRPYNIQNIGGKLYVAYALRFSNHQEAVPNPGAGLINVFDMNGQLITRLVSDGGPLRAPYGMALAPDSFGDTGGALLVGHAFGIDAFDPVSGAHRGTLRDEGGQPLRIPGLLGLAFGNGVAAGDTGTLYFTAQPSSFADANLDLFGSITPLAAPPATLISFDFRPEDGGTFHTFEGAGHIDIPVKREGDTTGTSTVDYATADRFGGQKSDYTIALGTLTFGPGETRKTFRVLIGDDHLFEAGTSVLYPLELSNARGAGIVMSNTPRPGLRIADNEGDTPRFTNLIDDPRFFVRQHYADFLNRVPDAGGLNFWMRPIVNCGDDPQCVERERVHVSAAFFLSIEFQSTGVLAYLTRRAGLGARPLYGQFMRDTQALQRGFVFGQPGWPAVLEANKQAFFVSFVRSPEFVAAFPVETTPAAFVDALFANAGFTPTAAERQAAIDEFNDAPNTADISDRADALRRVAENREFARREFNSAFVLMEYFGYLRRDPGGGFDFWLAKLNQFGGDFIRAEMVKAFITSIEYRGRFRHN